MEYIVKSALWIILWGDLMFGENMKQPVDAD